MTDKELNQKLNIINGTRTLGEVPVDCLPPVYSDEYYFVSYSHTDYKKVYADIFRFLELGINVWYDRGMSAGKSWEETAEEHVSRFACKGIIFYISENSLSSDAIHKEIAFAKKSGKACITVNLPVEHISGHEGEELSARALVDLMKQNGVDVPREKYDYISSTFSDEVLYLGYSARIDVKVDKIRSLRRPPLLEIERADGVNPTNVIRINDTNVQRIEEGDFALPSGEPIGYALNIKPCTFANCSKLKSVTFPSVFVNIEEYAFYDCAELESINLQHTSHIHDYAFCNCTSLKSAAIGAGYKRSYIGYNKKQLGHSAFYNCRSLEFVSLNEDFTSIGEKSFSHCESLKNFTLPKNIEEINEEAFSYSGLVNLDATYGGRLMRIGVDAFRSTRLASLDLSNMLVLTKIEDGAFTDCDKLQSVILPENLEELAGFVFSCCKNLKSVTFGKNDNLREIGACCFSETAIECIEIPDSVQVLGFKTFFECDKLERAYIGASVIENNIFYMCTKLKQLEFGNNVREIGKEIVEKCCSFEIMEFPDSVETIAEKAFPCLIESIKIGKGLKNIGSNSFARTVKNLEVSSRNPYLYSKNNCIITQADHKLVMHMRGNPLPEGIKIIGKHSVSLSKCETLLIPKSVELIESHAINGRLEQLILPENLLEIQKLAFANNFSEQSVVVIYPNVVRIGNKAFGKRLQTVKFMGTVAQWNSIEKAKTWNCCKCIVYCTDGEVVECVTSI